MLGTYAAVHQSDRQTCSRHISMQYVLTAARKGSRVSGQTGTEQLLATSVRSCYSIIPAYFQTEEKEEDQLELAA